MCTYFWGKYCDILGNVLSSAGVWWVSYCIAITREMIAYQIMEESKHLTEGPVVSNVLPWVTDLLPWLDLRFCFSLWNWSTAVVFCRHAVWQMICLYDAWASYVPQSTLLWLFMQHSVPQSPGIGPLLVPLCSFSPRCTSYQLAVFLFSSHSFLTFLASSSYCFLCLFFLFFISISSVFL